VEDPRIPRMEIQIQELIEEESQLKDDLLAARSAVIEAEASVHQVEARRLRLVDRLGELIMLQTLATAVEDATGVKKPVVGSS